MFIFILLFSGIKENLRKELTLFPKKLKYLGFKEATVPFVARFEIGREEEVLGKITRRKEELKYICVQKKKEFKKEMK